MPTKADQAVRDYLTALKDPKSIKDDDKVSQLTDDLKKADDPVERVKLRQQIMDAENPSPEQYADEFTVHARSWAEKTGIGVRAFLKEGVPPKVLRKAGFRVPREEVAADGGQRRTRTRVSTEEVRAAIPKSGEFTIKTLQEASGASPAVVRRVVQEEVDAGNVTEKGSDPAHRGPGRAPTVYAKA